MNAEEQRHVQIETLADHYRADTRWSVLWAFLFGPFYFAVWGFWGRAAVSLAACLILPVVGLIVAPLIVRKGWQERAEKQANRSLTVNAGINA